MLSATGLAAVSLGVSGCAEMTGGGGNDEEDEEDEQEEDEESEGTETDTTAADGQSVRDLRSISIGETRDGYIDEDDGNDPVSGDLAEPVTLRASSDTAVGITMESEEFDTYLILEGDNRQILARDDDGAGGLNSRIDIQVSQGTSYTIWAGSLDGDATGSYTLSVSSVEPEDQPDLQSISVGESKEGYIDIGDGRDPYRDSLAEPVELRGTAGTGVTISLESENIDTYLVLTGPDGSVVGENDDGGSGFDSQLTTTLSQTGAYTIWAGSFSGDATGAYTLSVSEATGSEDPANQPDLRSISIGETKEGFINDGDGQDPSYGGLAEPVELQAAAGTSVTISMESADIDTLLVLAGPDGTVVAEDDDGGTGFDSELTTTLSQTGTYTIWATSFSGTATGAYTLSVMQG